MRRFIPILLVFLALLVVETWQRYRSQPAEVATSAESAAEIPQSVPQAQVASRDGQIGKGTSFFVEMTKAGVAPTEIHAIVQASKRVFNFRRVKPGQAYSVFENSTGNLDSLHFSIDGQQTLKVFRDVDGFASRLDTVPYTIEHRVTSGTINSSIYQTLVDQKGNPELASHLANIFQWDIDFFKDIRKGDTFTVLYETKRYATDKVELGKVLSARVYTQKENHYAFLYTDQKNETNYYDAHGKSLQKSLLRAPLKFSRISSSFSNRRFHPVHKSYKAHHGVDYAAPTGTPVRATGDGTVTASTRNKGNGNYVKLRHNRNLETYYLHLSRFGRGIRQGTRVKQGQIIGYVGSTGTATASHLDYRIKKDGRFVNPRTVRLPSKKPVAKSEWQLFEASRDGYFLSLMEGTTQAATFVVSKPAPPLRRRMETVN